MTRLAHDVYILEQMDLAAIDRDRDVMARALCAGGDHATFFPVDGIEKGGHGHFLRKTNPAWVRAKTICEGCPVRLNCLGYAITNPFATLDGVWGGYDPEERREIRRRSRATH